MLPGSVRRRSLCWSMRLSAAHELAVAYNRKRFGFWRDRGQAKIVIWEIILRDFWHIGDLVFVNRG